jgi:hypothetical protein
VVEPGRLDDVAHAFDVLGGVAEAELLLRRGASLAPITEMLQ